MAIKTPTSLAERGRAKVISETRSRSVTRNIEMVVQSSVAFSCFGE